MRYFLTGATGFIGGHLARLLLRRGHEVVALVRSPEKAKALAEAGVELHPGDITDRESLRRPMTGADGVFHLAAWYKVGVKEPAAEQINVQGTRNVLELMRELRIPKGVYTSTLAVNSDTRGQLVDETYRFDGPHLSEYDRTKWRAHYEVALPLIREGLPLVIVQPGVVYGPGDTSSIHDVFSDYLRGRLPMVPKGAEYCWAHVEDVAMGHLLAMEKGRVGESYIIAGPRMTLLEALKLAEQITGKRAPRLQGAPGMLRGLSKVMGVVEKVLPLSGTMSSEGLRVAAGTTYIGDNAKARRELGYSPRPIEAGFPETLAWELEQLRK